MKQKKSTEQRRLQLAKITLEILATQGLRRFTTAELARQAGIAEGTIFKHFASKEEIVLAAVERIEEVFFGDFPPSHPNSLKKLGMFFQERMRMVRQQPGIAMLMLSEDLAHAAGASGAARVASMKERSHEFILQCLKEAVQQGDLWSELPVEHAFLLVRGCLLSDVELQRPGYRPPVDSVDPESIWNTLERMLRG